MPSKALGRSPRTRALSNPLRCLSPSSPNNSVRHYMLSRPSIGKSLNARLLIPTSRSSIASPPPVPSSQLGSSSPLANSANDSLHQTTCSAMPASRPLLSAAAIPAGFIGASSAQPSCAKHSSNGPYSPSLAPSGPPPSMSSRGAKVKHDKRHCGRSPTNGSEYFTTAGSPGNRTMKRATSMP